jgi:hypothetical protein
MGYFKYIKMISIQHILPHLATNEDCCLSKRLMRYHPLEEPRLLYYYTFTSLYVNSLILKLKNSCL